MSRLTITQKIHPISNRYVVHDAGGTEICHVKAKKFKLREELVMWQDDGESTAYARVKARSVIDFGGAYDVSDGAGTRVGTLRRRGMKSMLRVEWTIEDAGGQTLATVSEDSTAKALLRRFANVPLPIGFTFTAPDGTVLGHHKRRMGIRDVYDVDVAGIDPRLVAAIGVGLDLLEDR